VLPYLITLSALANTGAAIFHEAAPPSTDELEAVLLKTITRTMHTGDWQERQTT